MSEKTEQEKIAMCILFLEKRGYAVGKPKMNTKDIGRFLNVTNSCITNWLSVKTRGYKPNFPRPLQGHGKVLVWDAQEVRDWAEKHCEVVRD